MYAQQYVENDLMDKSPVELIRLLHSKAIEKLDQAVRHTGDGDIRARNSCLARVMEIVAELQGSLNIEAGGELALELARIYDYIQRRMIEAAADSKLLEELQETRVLLGNLYQGWQECEPPAALAQERSPDSAQDERTPQDASPNNPEVLVDEELPTYPTAAGYRSVEESRVWTL